MDFESKLPENLNHLMSQRQIMFAKLADELNISKSTLHGYRNGSLPHGILSIFKIAKFFELTIDELIFANLESKSPTSINLGQTRNSETKFDLPQPTDSIENQLFELHHQGKNSQEVWAWADNKKTEKKRLKIDDFVLPRFNCWKDGRQAEILRAFCSGIGIQSVKFHTLRACFATQLIKDGIAPAVIMKICGWKDLKTMQRYIRLAGIEVKGATEGLKIMPQEQVMGRVIELFSGN